MHLQGALNTLPKMLTAYSGVVQCTAWEAIHGSLSPIEAKINQCKEKRVFPGLNLSLFLYLMEAPWENAEPQHLPSWTKTGMFFKGLNL